jgi:heat shock protein HtpX
MIMILVDLAQLGALFGFGGNDEDSGPGFVQIVVLGPLAAALIQAAISRSREYAADASAADVTGDPIALASALAKIERAVQIRPLPPAPKTAPVGSLMIVNPFTGRTLLRMFSTHPDTRDHIVRLRAMAPDRRM